MDDDLIVRAEHVGIWETIKDSGRLLPNAAPMPKLLPRKKPGEIYCQVCWQPASTMLYRDAKVRWIHGGRAFPCALDLTTTSA